MKGQGCVYVIGCRFEDLRKESMGTSRALQVQWTRYPQPETMCYAYGNDTPIGPAEHTVDLTEKKGLRAFLVETKDGMQYNIRNLLRGTDDWDPLGQREYLSEAESEHLPVQLVLSRGIVELTEEHRSQPLSTRVKYFSGETQEHPELACEVTEDMSRIRLQRQGQELTLYGENDGVRTGKNRLLVHTETGLAAMAEIIVPPTTRPALRILRSQEASNAVAVFPVYYEKGLASPIGERCYTAGFVTGCRIEVQIRDGRLRAHLWTEKELPPSVEYPSEITVDTKAAAAGGSVGVLHTGTCGTGGWQNTVMLYGLRAE